MADIGISFSPTNDNSAQRNQTGNTASPVQDAIRILSFSLPKVLGASAVTPLQNLGGPSALGSQFGNSFLEQLLRHLITGAGPSGAPSPYDGIYGPGASAPPSPTAGGPPPSSPLPPGIILNPPRQPGPPDTTAPSAPSPGSPFPGGDMGRGRPY